MVENSTPSPLPIDTTVAHAARVWNYWLGGKDNYAVDREVGDEIAHGLPEVRELARSARGFLVRAVTHLAGDLGVRQFLDIGTGLPTHNNTHDVAQTLAPEARVVYVDNDPLVLAHAEALLIGTEEGSTDYIHADLREPDSILASARRILDLDQPVALLLMGVLEFVPDDEEAHAIVRRLVAALPPGSYLALYAATNVVYGRRAQESTRQWNHGGNMPMALRSPEQVARFFGGLDRLEPGVVSVSQWHPNLPEVGVAQPVDSYCGVARKPEQ